MAGWLTLLLPGFQNAEQPSTLPLSPKSSNSFDNKISLELHFNIT
jgi:hypothetical protein